MPKQLYARLEGRSSGDLSAVVRQDLSRYHALLKRARAEIRREKLFDADDMTNLLNATNGTLDFEPEFLAAEVEDHLAYRDMDPEEILAKLDKLTPLQLAALVDALERFWAGDEDEARGVFGAPPSGEEKAADGGS